MAEEGEGVSEDEDEGEGEGEGEGKGEGEGGGTVLAWQRRDQIETSGVRVGYGVATTERAPSAT